MPILRRKDENFFKTWTPAMAYILGFFAADGNLTKGKRGNFYTEFTSCDKDILEKIKTVFGCDHKISGRLRKSASKTVYRLQIGSKVMFADLQNLGFMPNKSKKLKYPPVPDKYFADFIRGYFDGDGHVTMGRYLRYGHLRKSDLIMSGFTCGTKTFLQHIHKKLVSKGIVRGGSLFYQGAYRLNFSVNDSLSLYSLLYNNLKGNLYLERKKKIFERFMGW